jgi:hypothetical protein
MNTSHRFSMLAEPRELIQLKRKWLYVAKKILVLVLASLLHNSGISFGVFQGSSGLYS